MTPTAQASDLLDVNAQGTSLKVHGGLALIEYRANGKARHVLAWGAINARTPESGLPQVRFKHDYSGGLKLEHRAMWVSFKNECRPYDGPPLVYLVTACKAPDGSYWALQSWQRNLPHRGWDTWTSGQRQWELRLSHWNGEMAHLELYADWAFHGDAHDIFGRMTYGGVPVHGFHTTLNGEPTDAYGRSLYIDTFDSAYGAGWKRETSIVFRKPSGAFCYSFWPTHDVSLPGKPARPDGHGTTYRISVVGPGVTPDVSAETLDLGTYDPQVERQQDVLFTNVIAGDKFCSTQH
ncbi:MAG TPA: hypothetical protein VH210_00040 [Gaiellaceae bacterium]|nr:hypothetical protein [Gaiellaceae bacterium]